jgi:hypothetical protein
VDCYRCNDKFGCHEVVTELISNCSPPILGYPNFTQPFELHTDASGRGLGAILYQEQEGHKRFIAYASRGLTKSEHHYTAHRLEFLGQDFKVVKTFSCASPQIHAILEFSTLDFFPFFFVVTGIRFVNGRAILEKSLSGLGAILYQEQEGHKRVIAYASRGLTKSEQHYPAHRLEFLALKWAVTDKFSDYLMTSKIIR